MHKKNKAWRKGKSKPKWDYQLKPLGTAMIKVTKHFCKYTEQRKPLYSVSGNVN